LYTPLLWEPDINILSNCVDEVLKMPQENISKLIGVTDSLGIKASSFATLLQPLNQFCELILCPEELEMGKRKIENNAFYIEPSISGRKGQEDISLLVEAAKGKKIIYASMGSQTVAYGNICHTFFDAILQVMCLKEMKDFHLVLSVGRGNEEREMRALSDNVSIVPWVSQLDILQVSSLAIIHGGLGTVKECIYYGVPMVVIPIVRDQPGNAKRVEHHYLGISVQPTAISPATLLHAIQFIMTSNDIRNGMRRMQTVFQQKEQAERGVAIIENLLKETTQSSKSRVC
jgi:zeaxanthin glucosyltransferase